MDHWRLGKVVKAAIPRYLTVCKVKAHFRHSHQLVIRCVSFARVRSQDVFTVVGYDLNLSNKTLFLRGNNLLLPSSLVAS